MEHALTDSAFRIAIADYLCSKATVTKRRQQMKTMQRQDIPEFVAAIVDTGCDITALPGLGYVIGDADLPRGQYREVAPKLDRIVERYGSRSHLVADISSYLTSIGKFYSLTAASEVTNLDR